MEKHRPPPRGRLNWRGSLVALCLLTLAPLGDQSAQADDRVDARQAYQAGMALIDAGELEAGVAKLEEAYGIRQEPVLLYQIGVAYYSAQDLRKALFWFERYVDTNPPDRIQIQQSIDQLEAYIAQVEAEAIRASSTVVATATPTPRPKQSTSSVSAAEGEHQLSPGVEARLNELLDKVDTLLAAQEAGVAQAPKSSSPQGEGASVGAGPGPEVALGLAEGEAGAERIDPYAQLVVTSSRYGQEAKDAPNALTVISAEDIRQSGVRTLPDLLRRVPGMEVLAISPGDYNLGIRGFNSTLANKVLILVDGRSVFLDFIGANLWPLLSISPEDIDRIEVIRGPGAALYGANAFSGVVNIITKRPGDPGDENSLYVRSGLPDYAQGSLHVNGRRGDVGYRFSAGFEQADRWSYAVDQDRPDYVITPRLPESATSVFRADGRIDQRLSDELLLSVSGGISQGQVEFAAIGSLRDYVIDGTYGYLRGDIALPQGVSIRAFWNRLDAVAQQWSYPTGGLPLFSEVNTDVVDVEVEKTGSGHLGVDHRYNLGVGYRYKGVSWDYLGSSPEENHFKLFAQDEMTLTPDLTFLGSLRVDRHPVIANRSGVGFFERVPTSPRGALIYRLDNEQTLRATVGTAFRTPTFLESYLDLYLPTSNTAAVVQSLGNLDLGPERIVSGEIGYLRSPADERYELQGAAFVNRVTDLIALSDVAGPEDPFNAYDPEVGYYVAGTTGQQNLPDPFTAVGGELAARFVPLRGLDLYGNYAYVYIFQDTELGRVRRESTSPHKVNGGVQYRSLDGLEASMDLSWMGDQIWTLQDFDENGQRITEDVLVPSHLWMSARVGFRDPQDRLELSLALTNLTALLRPEEVPDPSVTDVPQPVATSSRRFREHPVGQMVPPGISVGLRYRF